MRIERRYDIAVIGAGLAGLSLCRHLLLKGCRKTILLIDNRPDLPGKKQKVGESLVQVAGYYFTRILDLEEHLLREHYPKYNLRFHWKTPGRANLDIEDFGRSYIGKSSNVATYQLDRNKLEAHLIELLRQSPTVSLRTPVNSLQVELSENGTHVLRFNLDSEAVETRADWLIDTSGRAQLLKRKADLREESPIRHGASWCWVEGLVNVERLSGLSFREIRTRRDAQRQGLFPVWLATNHFCGEGFWFWVIPLKGLTSLGVVYDSNLFRAEEVSTPQKLLAWVCREFPLFERDLPNRKILDSGRLASYAYDCRQTISASRWAMSGMSGRFSDPLYSPGSDLIAYHNTLIVDALMEENPDRLKEKVDLYEALMRVVYDAYVPSYAVSYDTLGDQEVFTLKYAWELAVYFYFYAFPFINGLITDIRFIRVFFRKFAQLGPINRNLQKFFSDYYRWKKQEELSTEQVAKDFLGLTPLKKAEMCYYKTGLSVEQAEEELDAHVRSMRDFARFIYAYVSSVVVGDRQALLNRAFVSGIKLSRFAFDPAVIRRSYQDASACGEAYEWNLDPGAMDVFRTADVDRMSQVG